MGRLLWLVATFGRKLLCIVELYPLEPQAVVTVLYCLSMLANPEELLKSENTELGRSRKMWHSLSCGRNVYE